MKKTLGATLALLLLFLLLSFNTADAIFDGKELLAEQIGHIERAGEKNLY